MYVTSDTELIAKFRQIDGCAVVSEQQILALLKLLKAARRWRECGWDDLDEAHGLLCAAINACKDIPCE